MDSTVDRREPLFKLSKSRCRWILRGAWASMGYGVMLVVLSVTTMCHVNFGIGFGFGVDGVEALGLCCLQLLTCATACMVQKHLSTSSRHVVQWWVLAFALAKLGMAACDFILAVMYFNETLGAPSFEMGGFRLF